MGSAPRYIWVFNCRYAAAADPPDDSSNDSEDAAEFFAEGLLGPAPEAPSPPVDVPPAEDESPPAPLQPHVAAPNQVQPVEFMEGD